MKVIAFILLLLPFLSAAIGGNLRGGKNEVRSFTDNVKPDLLSALDVTNDLEEARGYDMAINELMGDENERRLSRYSYG